MNPDNSPQLTLNLQSACEAEHLPDAATLHLWAQQALTDLEQNSCELTIRIVNAKESQALNKRYRGKDKATNVLAFPADLPPELNDSHWLGDLVICATVVATEAQQQHKALLAHWAHMVIHGILHLRGFDHITESEAQQMEQRETIILQQLGFADPYQPVTEVTAS